MLPKYHAWILTILILCGANYCLCLDTVHREIMNEIAKVASDYQKTALQERYFDIFILYMFFK